MNDKMHLLHATNTELNCSVRILLISVMLSFKKNLALLTLQFVYYLVIEM